MNFQNGIIAGIVSVVVALVTVFAATPAAPTPVNNTVGVSQTNVGEFPEGALIGDAFVKVVTGTIPAGSNQASFRNTTGKTVYVDQVIVRTTGTASTTQRISVGSGSSATIADFTLPTYALSSLLNYVLATSSAATTTSSVHGAGATDRAGVIAVADGDYINIALTQTFVQGNCSGSVCETATSTNRGFNLEYLIRVLQIK